MTRLPKFEAGPDRASLRFKEAVLANFGFLCTYQMSVVRTESTLVRFESTRIFLNVYHGRGSYEVGVDVGKLGRRGSYGLDRIVAEAAALKIEGFGTHTMFQSSNREGVAGAVAGVAALLRTYGANFLKGEEAFYAMLEAEDRTWAGSYELRLRRDRAREAAEQARMSKDYATLVRAYESIIDDLTPLEIARLGYARRQVEKR